MSLLSEYEELCELHKLVTKLASEYYRSLYLERATIKRLKNKYRPNENYTKWCQKARRIARKNMNRVAGQRLVVDHKIPLLKMFLDGVTPEVASRKENLQLLTKQENRKKSYLI
jgi:hypothetical protein